MRDTLSLALQEQALYVTPPMGTKAVEVLQRDEAKVTERDGDHVYQRET